MGPMTAIFPGALLSGNAPLFFSNTMLSSPALSAISRFAVGSDFGERNLVERARSRRIEHAQLKSPSVKALGGLCDQIFRDEALTDGVGEFVESWGPDAAGEIGSRLQ